MSADSQTRVLFLVTTPIKESINSLLYKAARLIGRSAGPTQAINWDVTSSPISSIPTIEPHLSFTRHFALGTMDRGVWEDPSLTNLHRFRRARFWEHRGSTGEPRQGGDWGEDEIRQIEAIQFLGWTEKSNDIITNEYASVLLQGWEYLPVWWNCQSFATRLAFLVAELELFREKVAVLAHKLHTELVQWFISRRDSAIGITFVSTWFGGVGSWTGAVVSISVFPPAAAVFTTGFLVCWGVGFATGMTGFIFQGIDVVEYKRFQANLKKLETKFPLLRQLHEYLDSQYRSTEVRRSVHVWRCVERSWSR